MSNIDPGKFYEFEHRGWEEVARFYHNSWALVTRQAIEPLLDAAHVCVATHVLDVGGRAGLRRRRCCCTRCDAIGIDLSSEMVADARNRYLGVDFWQGDAEHLPVANSVFDTVVLNFGILHLA